jgi:hypothetical protein
VSYLKRFVYRPPQVKVWNLLPVADVAAELNPAVPKLLATLADHFAPVNVARFSCGGTLLASGAALRSLHSCSVSAEVRDCSGCQRQRRPVAIAAACC